MFLIFILYGRDGGGRTLDVVYNETLALCRQDDANLNYVPKFTPLDTGIIGAKVSHSWLSVLYNIYYIDFDLHIVTRPLISK